MHITLHKRLFFFDELRIIFVYIALNTSWSFSLSGDVTVQRTKRDAIRGWRYPHIYSICHRQYGVKGYHDISWNIKPSSVLSGVCTYCVGLLIPRRTRSERQASTESLLNSSDHVSMVQSIVIVKVEEIKAPSESWFTNTCLIWMTEGCLSSSMSQSFYDYCQYKVHCVFYSLSEWPGIAFLRNSHECRDDCIRFPLFFVFNRQNI